MLPEDIGNWYVRGSDGRMVAVLGLLNLTLGYGSPRLERYNGLPSMEILGQAAPGRSTGEAMTMMEELAKNCLRVLVMTGPVCPIRNVVR